MKASKLQSAGNPLLPPMISEADRLLSQHRANFADYASRVSHQREWSAEEVERSFQEAREAAWQHAEALNFAGVKEKPPKDPPQPVLSRPHRPPGGPPAAGQRPKRDLPPESGD
eukprot:TRINITY_DN69890_c0_g1_i2.p1 TRINITY_DN69890_c0_g1~~TRINITY_DN69890_c0_g1_i2.p1  ORF type:complete len:114 (-),score=21.72 TRINITY_DN69890_c0_g1_i2:249-590(-)